MSEPPPADAADAADAAGAADDTVIGPVVYLLRNGRAHYVGATVHLRRRIRQHNGELKGGARRTARRQGGWVHVLHVTGFRTFRESLMFEFALKRETRRHGYTPEARDRALAALLRRDRWTCNSPPAAEVPLRVARVLQHM